MFTFKNLPLDAPLRITSHFGTRNTGIKGASTNHKGIDLGRDLSKSVNPNILAVQAGTVVKNEWNKYRGWYVVIQHDNTYSTLYQHLAKQSDLKVNTVVNYGDVIGVMGNSSDTAVLKCAVHLHFELWEHGTPIDPEDYLLFIANQYPACKSKDKGFFVELLQRYLNELQYSCGAVDGSFGTKTVTAVKNFQKANKLTVDGSVGTKTWTAIRKLLK